MDLPGWQCLYEELRDRGFVIVAVALDSRDDAARPWIEAAKPGYPCLIDRDHHVADLYGMVNVPQAVWIDERGRIVRPTEAAGAWEGFRQMDRQSFQMPEEALATAQRAKESYVAAIRDWVARGASSEFALDPAQVRAHLELPGDDVARAHASFRLGQHLLRTGNDVEGRSFVEEAIRLRPESWSFWRQNAEPSVMGLAAGPEFWARVDALGEKRYYARIDMKGMP
jgi:hypothetical protein